jgi:hypothetical protein
VDLLLERVPELGDLLDGGAQHVDRVDGLVGQRASALSCCWTRRSSSATRRSVARRSSSSPYSARPGRAWVVARRSATVVMGANFALTQLAVDGFPRRRDDVIDREPVRDGGQPLAALVVLVVLCAVQTATYLCVPSLVLAALERRRA